jgi:hypothetical protein
MRTDHVVVEPNGAGSVARQQNDEKADLDLVVQREPEAEEDVGHAFNSRIDGETNPIHQPLKKDIFFVVFDCLISAEGRKHSADGDAKIRSTDRIATNETEKQSGLVEHLAVFVRLENRKGCGSFQGRARSR